MQDKAQKALPELTHGFLFPIKHILCVLVAKFTTQRKAVHFFLDSKQAACSLAKRVSSVLSCKYQWNKRSVAAVFVWKTNTAAPPAILGSGSSNSS